MNRHIENALNLYLQDPDPNYAVAICGKWGCGKSYFIDKWLKSIAKKEENIEDAEDDDAVIVLQPIFISIYGLREVKDICSAIDKELHPFLYSKSVKVAKNIFKVLGKVVLHTNIDLNNDNSEDISMELPLDSLDLLKSNDENIKGDKVLVIDDFERSNIDTKELMGFINFLVERAHVHVVVIGDFSKLKEEDKKVLDEFEEKTIGKKFIVLPDLKGALDSFLNEIPKNDWTCSQIQLILDSFNAVECTNLRILRRVVHDFNSAVTNLSQEDMNTSFMLGFLSCFVITASLYHNKEYRELLRNYRTDYMSAIADNNADKFKISSLQNRCNPITNKIGYNVLNPMDIEAVVSYLDGVRNLEGHIRNGINREQTELPLLDKLSMFINLEDDEFKELCDELEARISNKKLPTAFELGRSIAVLINLDTEKMHSLNNDILNATTDSFRDMLASCNSAEDVYKTTAGFNNGFAYQIKATGADINLLDQIKAVANERLKNVSNQMEDLLLNLTDDNILEVIKMDDQTAPDGQAPYYLTSIFQNLDPAGIFDRIENLSNKGVSIFNDFLRHHYRLDTTIIGLTNNIFKGDITFISDLKGLVGKAINEMPQGPRKYNFSILQSTLDNTLNMICK